MAGAEKLALLSLLLLAFRMRTNRRDLVSINSTNSYHVNGLKSLHNLLVENTGYNILLCTCVPCKRHANKNLTLLTYF